MSIFYSLSGTAFRAHHNDIFGPSVNLFHVPTTYNINYIRVKGDKIFVRYNAREIVYSREDYSVLSDITFTGDWGYWPISDDGTKTCRYPWPNLHIIDSITRATLFSFEANGNNSFVEAEDNTFYALTYNNADVKIRRVNWEGEILSSISFQIPFSSPDVYPLIDIGDNFLICARRTANNAIFYQVSKDLNTVIMLPVPSFEGWPQYLCFYQNRLYFHRSIANHIADIAHRSYYDFDTQLLHEEAVTGVPSASPSVNQRLYSVGPIRLTMTTWGTLCFNYETNQQISAGVADVQSTKYTLQGVIKNSLNQPAERDIALITKKGALITRTKSDPVTGAYSLNVGEGFSSLSRVVFSDEPNRNDIIDRINFT